MRQHTIDGREVRRLGARSAALVAVVVVVLAAAALEHRRTAAHREADVQPWELLIDHVDTALDRGDLRGARRALASAAAAAARSRSWQSLIAVGDAQRRVAMAAGYPELATRGARENYAAALKRARALCSLDGALRATLAFAALGDEAFVTVGLRVARELAPTDAQTQAELSATAARLQVLATQVAARAAE